ncbi:MAG: hypothetical protein LBF54_00510 [Holosporaceae bacterium]|jgi:hypothetical protein|nr:hypothetical protein [Holosporaceae bacterium]
MEYAGKTQKMGARFWAIIIMTLYGKGMMTGSVIATPVSGSSSKMSDFLGQLKMPDIILVTSAGRILSCRIFSR